MQDNNMAGNKATTDLTGSHLRIEGKVSSPIVCVLQPEQH